VVERRFCRGFCGFRVAKRGELRGTSWWICGENVVLACSSSGPEKHANFLNYFCGFLLEARLKTVRELIAVAGLVFAAAAVADFYSRLPERIATHFNEAGVANGLGARSTLWVLVGIAVLLYSTLSAISFVPRVVNLKRPLAPERERVVLAESMEMVGWIKAEVCWMFAYLCLAMVRNGMGLQAGLGWWFLPITLVVVLGTCAFYLVRIFGAIRGA
jgi:uncharacterized membrane protein